MAAAEAYVRGEALLQAAISGNEPVVRLLLNHGGLYGKHEALEKAALNGHQAVVRSLLENYADVTQETGMEWHHYISQP